MEVTIYHNPRCSKSREALAALKENDSVTLKIREYLKEPLTADELTLLLQKLNINAAELLRKGESIFKEEYKYLDLTNQEWIQVMVSHPKLIERPIVEVENRAVVARPKDKLEEIL